MAALPEARPPGADPAPGDVAGAGPISTYQMTSAATVEICSC
jgi:hypothetical protein